MSRGGIIISNNSDGRGMMLPEREGSYTFNKLPFISMQNPKDQVGLNPIEKKIIINTKKLNKKKEPKKSLKNKFYPLENYRKIKTSQQFWKKNENPLFKEFNKKKEDEKTWIEIAEKYQPKENNKFCELIDTNNLNYSDIEYIKSKKLFSAPKTTQKLIKPIINYNNNNNKALCLSAKKEENKNDNDKFTIKPELKDVKVCPEEKNNNLINDKLNENIDKIREAIKDYSYYKYNLDQIILYSVIDKKEEDEEKFDYLYKDFENNESYSIIDKYLFVKILFDAKNKYKYDLSLINDILYFIQKIPIYIIFNLDKNIEIDFYKIFQLEWIKLLLNENGKKYIEDIISYLDENKSFTVENIEKFLSHIEYDND